MGNRNSGPSGPTLVFAETDYREGSGSLRMTVERVAWSFPLEQGGERWYKVSGVEVTGDGRRLGPRHAWVKGRVLSCLPRNNRR